MKAKVTVTTPGGFWYITVEAEDVLHALELAHDYCREDWNHETLEGPDSTVSLPRAGQC